MSLPSGSNTLASVYTDFQGLNGLRAAAHAHRPAAKVEAAKQFEALFIDMMLKAMREATPKNSLFGSSQQRLYQGLYDHQLALNMAQGQGVGGLLPMIEKALGASRANPATTPAATAQAAIAPRAMRGPVGAPVQPTRAGSPAGEAAWPPASPEQFVQAVLPYAKAAARKIGVAPAVLIAQAALESGWGQHVPAGPNGASSNNLLGIKTGGGWSGAKVSVPTLEYRDGVARRSQASFRAYPSIAACFANYAQLITGHPRYQQAVAQGGDPAAYLDGLQKAGYATDPAYAAKVKAVLNSGAFIASAGNVKNAVSSPLT